MTVSSRNCHQAVISDSASFLAEFDLEKVHERSPLALYGGRVLVIDDEPHLVSILSRALPSFGLRVDGASDGTTGLALALGGRYDVVLLDLRLPDSSGTTVLRRIMETRPEQRVVVCTAVTDPEQKARCLALGAADYVTKPFDLPELVARLRAQLGPPARLQPPNHDTKEYVMRRAAAKALLLVGIATLALAGAGQALAAGLKGTVLTKERARHALVIAGDSATVRTVRVTGAYRLRPGARISSKAARLRDGTYRAGAVRRVGRAARARINGTVLRTRRGGYFLSAGKSVLFIRNRAARPMSTEGSGPRRGDNIVVRVSISQSGALAQQGPAQTVTQGARMEVVGTLTAVTNATASAPGSVTVTAETPGVPPAPAVKTAFTCNVPAGFPDLSSFLNKVVEIECSLANGQWVLDELSAPGQRGVEDEDEDEDETEGAVTALTAPTATTTGSITVGSLTCTIPAGFDILGIKVGDDVEIECEGGILTEIETEGVEEDD
jgi:CheY-like chemotaxis protein